jgi:hypothetical protein
MPKMARMIRFFMREVLRLRMMVLVTV